MLPLITVIIPTYNRQQLLAYTLQSIVNQGIRKEFVEVIVVDDGSTDATAEVVTGFAKVLNLKYHYQPDEGYRVASARNVGIENAKGEILIFIDSGIILAAACIEAHLRAHLSGEADKAVIGYVYGFDQENTSNKLLERIIDCHNPDQTIEHFRQNGIFLDLREAHYRKYNDALPSLPAPWAFFWTCNISVRKKSLNLIGGFDQNYDLCWGVEDLDLGLRLHQHNVQITLSREAGSIHYPHHKDVESKYKQNLKNKAYFHKKHQAYFHEKHQLGNAEAYLAIEDVILNDALHAPCPSDRPLFESTKIGN